MQHLDEGTIHAWLDGELPLEERAAVEAHVAECDECRAAVAEARGFIAASSRILTALDAVPGGVLPAADAPRGAQHGATSRFALPRAMRSRAWMAAAAVLVLSTVTVIAVRPGEKPAALRLGEARDETKQVATYSAAAPAEKRSANEPAPRPVAAPAPPPAPAPSPAAAPAAAPKPADALAAAPQPYADKSPSAEQAFARKDVAAPAPPAPAPAPASAASVTVEPSGTLSAKLGMVADAAVESPRLLSRSTTKEAGDTVVTTIYSVQGVPVSLIDRSSPREETRRAARAPAVAQSMAKSRDNAQTMNSLTWSDSSGHTRTLRGAIPLDELQKLKRALFGATP